MLLAAFVFAGLAAAHYHSSSGCRGCSYGGQGGSDTCGHDYTCQYSNHYQRNCCEYTGGSHNNPSQRCPWADDTGLEDTFRCSDNSLCNGRRDGWDCCKKGRGGNRIQCPSNLPVMCQAKTCSGMNCCASQHCGGDLGRERVDYSENCEHFNTGGNSCIYTCT